MRQVFRNSVQTPQKLADLYSDQAKFDEAKLAITQDKPIRKGLYRHRSVEIALESLYKNVCFLCQRGVKANYDVEHLLPWSKYYAVRAYDWDNLHQSCKECNQRKKRHDYKQLDPNNRERVTDILLLDPTKDQVDKLITFDPLSSEAVVTQLGGTVQKANSTTHFLNDDGYVLARTAHWKVINDIFLEDEWIEAYSRLRKAYTNFKQVTLNFDDEVDQKVGSLCYRIVVGYLAINKPYNIYVLRVMNTNIKVSPYALKHFAEQHCAHTGAALPSLVV